ncbi:MAG TPA: excinuclease ABC subunit B [Clostridiales bacterium]|nr:excinuclease ABC subunit B [Clostridiales bacterium]
MDFKLVSSFSPCGDQPQAIEKLVQGARDGLSTQVLLGVTGSGKTFTMASVIEKLNRPALVIAHNKTLAAQLCNEFRELFPHNRVEFFVSYYDYYQPEAYVPSKDLYIEKELDINDEIDKLRHSATSSLCERHDTIVVASVSCIYGLGAPKEYYSHAVSLREGAEADREQIIHALVNIQYTRSDMDFHRGTFRARGDVLDIFPISYSDSAIRVEFFGDEIDRISEFDVITGKLRSTLKHVNIFPASHYIVGGESVESVLARINADMLTAEKEFTEQGKAIEAQRIRERVLYDTEMIREVGYCSGIENYSRYFDGREPGTPPYTLTDFFPEDFIVFIDESHMTLPQIRAMYNGDKARKKNLVDYGFRLPAAYDNRPLKFDEFIERVPQMICVSATPGPYELAQAGQVVEQVIRPTGLLDPVVTVKPIKGQIDDLLGEIKKTAAKGYRTLVTTLTKRMAENLTDYLKEEGVKAIYMHSDIVTLERIKTVNALREGEYDVLVGINLLREGLDLPEVGLIAILDADKEGFLRSETSLVQTIGRAARNVDGRVIMYADVITDSMKRAIEETERRRGLQDAHNKKFGITPKSVVKRIVNTIEITKPVKEAEEIKKNYTSKELDHQIELTTALMKRAAAALDFESAIELREQLAVLQGLKKRGK